MGSPLLSLKTNKHCIRSMSATEQRTIQHTNIIAQTAHLFNHYIEEGIITKLTEIYRQHTVEREFQKIYSVDFRKPLDKSENLSPI